MNILGLIPARGGSKRIPGKNIKLLGGLPLIAWTIRAAIHSEMCSNIVVSTDDLEIATIARQYGASVPELRPSHLATDRATSVDVALYELERHERKHGNMDALLLLQPTSPFRTAETITRAVSHYQMTKGCNALVSVSKAPVHPDWCFRIKGAEMEPYLGRFALGRRSQDLETAYVLNGAIYLISPAVLRYEQSFMPAHATPFVMKSQKESLDIDTEDDWAMAEFFLAHPTFGQEFRKPLAK